MLLFSRRYAVEEGEPTDPDFSSVTFLIQSEVSNGNTTDPDFSSVVFLIQSEVP